MTKTYTTENNHRADPGEVLRILTNESFLIEREKAQGAIEARVEELERSEDELRLRLHATEYGRTMTGGLDKSKREKSATEYTWDLKKMHGRWSYRGTHGNRINVSGSFQLSPHDSGTRVVSNYEVKVNIPVLGGKIEKMIIREIEKSSPISAEVLTRFLSASEKKPT